MRYLRITILPAHHNETIFSHVRHFTFVKSGSRENFFEPHLGQIGHARRGFISVQLVLYQSC